jgi:spermidine synthase
LTDLHNLVRVALGEAFPHVRPIPGETILWLASPSPGTLRAGDDVDALVARWEAAGPDAQLITAPYIRYKFDEARATWFQETLVRGRAVPLNEDLRPTGVFHGLVYWNALFSPDLAASFKALTGLSLPVLVAVVAVALGGVWVAGTWVRGFRRATVPLAVGTTGFGGMAADIIVIFAFQTLQGHVYHQIGLLIAAFMAGLTAGGLATNWGLRRCRASRRWLVALEAAVLGFWIVCPLLLVGLVRLGSMEIVLPALLAVNVGAGLLVGAEFPLANALAAGDDTSRTAGFFYAVDLAGAFAGAVLVAVVLVPVLGVVETCLLVAVLKVGSLLLVATRAPQDL